MLHGSHQSAARRDRPRALRRRLHHRGLAATTCPACPSRSSRTSTASAPGRPVYESPRRDGRRLGAVRGLGAAPGRRHRRGARRGLGQVARPGTPREIFPLQTDPYVIAPLGLDPVSVAGLQARALLDAGIATERDFAEVVSRSRRDALSNPNAQVAKDVSIDELLDGALLREPAAHARPAADLRRRRRRADRARRSARASSRTSRSGSAASTTASTRTTWACAT